MSTRELLDKTRDGYDEECRWMRFLIDAYTGRGGFQGRIQQPPAGFWGAAAEAYRGVASLLGSRKADSSSYLDRYTREDEDKFQRRVAVAHYLNYVRPTTALKVSYIVRRPHKRRNVPEQLEAWIERTKYDEGFRRRVLVCAVLGWFPLLVDMPARRPAAQTRAQAGNLDPYAVLSLPCHLKDYQLDEEGRFVWAKMVTTFVDKPRWDAEPETVTRTTVWTRDEFEIFESRGDAQAEAVRTGGGRHSFRQVPIVSWRADTSVEDPVKADSINADIALEGRRLFNLLSELDEHMRSQVFAILIYPQSAPTPTDTVEVGTNNGLQVSSEQKNLPFFLAPPASIAETYEKRIAASVIEIYRLARVEYDRASGVESSAQSKKQNFEQTNLSIADIATAIAHADRETLILVGRGLGIADDKLEAIECVAHESYATDDLALELEQVITALTIRELGAQLRIELLSRLAQQLLPHMSAETRAIVEQEISDAVRRSEQEAELARDAPAPDDDEPPPEPAEGRSGDDDDDEDMPDAAE